MAAVLATTVIVSACGGSSGSAVPQGGGPIGSTAQGCLDVRAATAIWTDVNNRLNAVTLSPAHRGLDGVATGAAAALLRQYIAVQLIAKNLTEREVDRLDNLIVTDAACSGGQLVVEVRETLVRDDYLAGDGHVDHADPKVGMHSHFEKTFVHAGATWKLSDLQDLDSPGPTTPPTTV